MPKSAKETQIGQLVISLKVKADALESGLKVAQEKIKELENSNGSLKNSNKSLEGSWLSVSNTATKVFDTIISAIKDGVDEYNSYTQAMESLSDVADYTGQSLDDMSSIMKKYQTVMNKSDIAATIKNFSLMGFTIKQTDQMMQSLTNSAIRNRNSNYTVSEAVKVASDGYRQGLSTLSDSAGVTENLSVMLNEYAKSIGKTASQLTEAEQNQAYLNRTMAASEPFAGAMEGYLDSLAGKQGAYSQAMRETQVAYTEALQPALSGLLSIGTSILQLFTSLISEHPHITTFVTSFTVILAGLTIVFVALKAAIDFFTKATAKATLATNAFTAALMSNPLGIIAVAIAAVVAGIIAFTSAIREHNQAEAEAEETGRRYNDMLSGRLEYTDENIKKIKEEKDAIDNQIESIQRMGQLQFDNEFGVGISKDEKKELKELEKEYEPLIKSMGNYGVALEKLKEQSTEYGKYLEQANAIEKITNGLATENVKTKQKQAAQLKVNVKQMQDYLNVVKNGNKESSEYKNAVKALSEAYPEAASAGGILIDICQGLIDSESLEADVAWKSAQDQINAQIAIINAALSSEEAQIQAAQNIGISQEELQEKLRTTLALYQAMAAYNPEDVPNITPVSTSSSSVSSSGASSSYSNDALDNYKKEIEHKKNLDQITLKEEIQMYQYALDVYAQTAEERMELREKIYDLNKELAQKEKDILDEQTEDYENYIQDQKNKRGAAYDIVEQTRDYDKIINMHKNYLNQIMQDERLSLDERKKLYREELQTIRDYEQQKRDLRVESVDNTVSQLTNALTKSLEKAQEKEKEAIDKNLEEVEKWKNARIDAINAEYDARLEAINKELELLNKSEQEKTRAEEDAEFERKKLRLEELIEYEHDATTRANYQKQLDKLLAEYQKTLDNRALQDKKDALNEQKQLIKDEQDALTQAVEDEADKRKEEYEKQLEDLENYYEEQIEMAQETAEKMLLNVEKNQDKIMELLKSYGDKYEITGQTLGEKLAQGVNDGLANKIQNMIQRVQDTIDSSLTAKIKEWTSSGYKYTEGENKPVTQNITVNQTNNIAQNPEMPSETYRKLNNISINLAAELSEV